MNDELCLIPSDAEILETLRDKDSHKISGPDVMLGLFFKHFWSIVEPEVQEMVKAFFTRDFMSSEVNHSHIVLIPKIDNPSEIFHFRPISLCNVSYKLIAKILANRLRPVLSHIISPFQYAFAKGRVIQDNLVLTHEIFHMLRSKRKGRQYMVVRTNIEKVYDRME